MELSGETRSGPFLLDLATSRAFSKICFPLSALPSLPYASAIEFSAETA